ncbi:MAG: uracil-DNA glycosylase [Hyphomicrobiaceae bacterium]
MENGSDHQAFDMSDDRARDTALTALLAWYRDMGVDDAVADDATNWLARGQEPPARLVARKPAPPGTKASDANASPQAPSTAPGQRPTAPASAPPPAAARPAAPSVTISDEAAEANARDAARQAKSLDELHALLRAFDGCGLKATAKNLCFYRGAAQARVMIIGEAPGRDEDRAGIPFVGPAGQLLDKMLASIELSEADTHITNVVYWRPPGNRVPTPQETLICRPFLERQIRLVRPELVVTVGGAAAKLILNTTQGIMKVRGKWGAMAVPADAGEETLEVPVMPTLHPAYLLRSPAHKRHAWRDLLAIRAKLDAT